MGTGIADDKAIYAYMPRIIRYYLDQEPVLANVTTHICGEAEGLQYTLDNLGELVVKPVGESGGYGLIIGPHASAGEIDAFRAQLLADPANYISQPMISLSVSPTLAGNSLSPRHIDLRPFAITGRKTWVLPGGLTRVALRRGLARGQFIPGRRFERHLGSGIAYVSVTVAIPIRRRFAVTIAVAVAKLPVRGADLRPQA